MNNIAITGEEVFGKTIIFIVHIMTYLAKAFSHLCTSMHFSLLQMIILIIVMRIIIKNNLARKLLIYLVSKFLLYTKQILKK